jgi:hypothetical protein
MPLLDRRALSPSLSFSLCLHPSPNFGFSLLTFLYVPYELTHYAQCYVKWGQVSSEEVAEQGAVICIGTVQEALDRAKAKAKEKEKEKEGKQK